MVGEEGKEYAALAEELSSSRDQSASPEQTRTVGEDVKLHAPKPSLPPMSAKQRVMAVTRTDSDKAASFGIGRPSSEDPVPSNRSLKKKASTISQLSTSENVDDEQGIPEIGQQVPMYPNAGDVQAPSPAPGSEGYRKHHKRKSSARGLPPGSYGLHGHGVVPQDKLERAYFEKHPELLKKERHPHHHDRPYDFSMSSDDLNKIVRSESGPHDAAGTPGEQIEWKAYEQTTSRITSPRPPSTKPEKASSLRRSSGPEISVSDADEEKEVIHIDEPERRKSVVFSDEELAEDEEDHPYTAPIIAEDAKHESPFENAPAVDPPRERRGSAFEMDPPHSRPTSRPSSIYRVESSEPKPSTLEDVEEYEPLFPEEEKSGKKPTAAEVAKAKLLKQRFPSRDIWEDAPDSVHYSAEVSTPELPEEAEKEKALEHPMDIPPRDGETPAQAFARHQEELAEKESKNSESFLHRQQKPTSWAQHRLAQETASSRPSMAQRFPSQDVWEDTPDSLKLETTVSTPQLEDSPQPESPQQPQRAAKPAIPERPKPKSPEETSKPIIPDRPKPQVPARPRKASTSETKEAAAPAPKPKPAVPARPMGSKIAALQAGFMSDLNKKLGLGPQAPKKEEPAAEDLIEEKEKAPPLQDARKGRARGPQRRAPAATSPSPAAATRSEAPAPAEKPRLSFATTVTVFTIDPDEGSISVTEAIADSEPLVGSETKEPELPKEAESKPEAKVEVQPEDTSEPKQNDPVEEKTETLATNTAGETLVEATVEEDKDQTVEPTEVDPNTAKE